MHESTTLQDCQPLCSEGHCGPHFAQLLLPDFPSSCQAEGWLRFLQTLSAMIQAGEPVPKLCSLAERICEEHRTVAQGVAAAALPACLSPRQIECLVLAAQGKTSAETAHYLNVSVRTVNFHFSKIFAKLGVKNKQAAVALAIQRRYI